MSEIIKMKPRWEHDSERLQEIIRNCIHNIESGFDLPWEWQEEVEDILMTYTESRR